MLRRVVVSFRSSKRPDEKAFQPYITSSVRNLKITIRDGIQGGEKRITRINLLNHSRCTIS